MQTFSRRGFLQAASTGTALALTAAGYARVKGANDRLSIALIGCGGRGREALMPGVYKHHQEQNLEITAVCDPWRIRRELAAAKCREWYNRDVRQFSSYRDVVALADVDAVLIGSCDHQHCAHLEAAARARKDAYCEKPLAMDMASLKRACDAVKANGIVTQMGTQWRSYPTSAGCRKLVRSGALGKISRIEQRRNSTKPYWYSRLAPADPRDVDWKEFLMDRPARPFDARLLSGWYGYREFSDGPVSGLGAHFIAMLNYVTGSTLPASCVCQGGTFTWKDENKFSCPDQVEATWIYPEGFMASYSTNCGNGSGSVCRICGEQGVIDLASWTKPTFSRAGASKPSKLPTQETPVEAVACPDHFLNWLQCLRSRKPTICPIESGYEHSVAVIMAVRAMDTGRRQVYDPVQREIHDG
jgi:predicted dehydrogenase